MASTLFNGNAIKLLKDILRFKSGIEIISNDSDDPTSVAKNAPRGSLYIRLGTQDLYIKKDAGSSTNWVRLGTLDDLLNYANITLSNLGTVAINTSLISDTNNTDDLGSDTIEWKDLWVHNIQHADAVNPDLVLSTGSNNGNISLNPHGTGYVDVNSSLISNVTDPVSAQDAATKAYADLKVKKFTISTITTNTNAVVDNVYLVGTNTAAVTVTIPAAVADARIVIKDKDGNAMNNNITISGTVDGISNPVLSNAYECAELLCDGTNWWRI